MSRTNEGELNSVRNDPHSLSSFKDAQGPTLAPLGDIAIVVAFCQRTCVFLPKWPIVMFSASFLPFLCSGKAEKKHP